MQNNTFSTLFVGQNLIKLLVVDSTNNFLKDLMSKSEPLPEGTVIMADHQFAGRGQQENVWIADPCKNLTLSIYLRPYFLPLNKQFLLNMAVSVAINRALTAFVPSGITVKWPNDIYYGDKKLGGVLIESAIAGGSIKNSIIGIGLNVNQVSFPVDLSKKATSIRQILQEDVNLDLILAQICSHVESSYLQLKAGRYRIIKEEYLKILYKINASAMYRQNGEVFEGMVKDISDSGLLMMEVQGKIAQFNFKEVEFLTDYN